jgi:phytoene/squalene synthetase
MLAVAWLGQGAINALAQVSARYRFPSEWLVAVFAALAVEALRRRYGARRALGITLALVALGAAALAAQLLKRAG